MSMGLKANADGSGAVQVGGSDAITITSGLGVLAVAPTGLGYGTGAGGTVTQLTSKATAVTLNKPTGQITMNNAALAAGATVSFSVFNSICGQNDVAVVSAYNNANYRVTVLYNKNIEFAIQVTNTTGGSLSEALVINFAIIKGATS